MAPLAVAIVLFSVSNRTDITLRIWPLPGTIDVPLFAIVLICLGAGIIWGGLAAWLAAGKSRKRAREANRRAEQAERDARFASERVSELEAEAKSAAGASSTAVTTVSQDAA